MRQCDKCTKPFEVPPSALNKRFCSARCRDLWHAQQRREVAEELQRRRQASATSDLAEVIATGEPNGYQHD